MMREEDLEKTIKVLIIGNGAVGKSSMIQRYCKGIFTKDYKKTIGVDFLERQIEVNYEDVRLMLWDTAGQEEFHAITKAYYRGAQACVLAFSTVDRASFDAVKHWKKKVEEEVGSIAMVLVQNKIDLINEALITKEEADNLAESMNVKLYHTSAKDNLNVDEVFRKLAEQYLIESAKENEISESPMLEIANESNLFREPPKNSKNSKRITSNGIIHLKPSKQRTKGKYSFLHKCFIK